jgi:hypothetical protein
VSWIRWLTRAIVEEEQELETAIHPQRGSSRDALAAGASVAIVVGASVAMEQSASTLGGRHRVPEIVLGGMILAAVTSLPNAVAAVYLARRGRGPATLSTAMNSNALNILAGLLLPGVIVGLGAPTPGGAFHRNLVPRADRGRAALRVLGAWPAAPARHADRRALRRLRVRGLDGGVRVGGGRARVDREWSRGRPGLRRIGEPPFEPACRPRAVRAVASRRPACGPAGARAR